jgi:hypothetical protein
MKEQSQHASNDIAHSKKSELLVISLAGFEDTGIIVGS